MARPGRLAELGRFLEEAALGALYPVGRCIEPGVFTARRAVRLVRQSWRTAGVAALAIIVWSFSPWGSAERAPSLDGGRTVSTTTARLARVLATDARVRIEVALRDAVSREEREARARAKAAARRRFQLQPPYRGCAEVPGMSTRAERRRCPRKVQATVRPGEPTCLCVQGAVLGIPPDAALSGIEVTLEAVKADENDYFFDKPLSKRFEARFSRGQQLSSAATLWIDLPARAPQDVRGEAMFSRGGPCGTFSPWEMRALAPDKATNTLGFVLGSLPLTAFATAVTPR
jgi:hypothetical protein